MVDVLSRPKVIAFLGVTLPDLCGFLEVDDDRRVNRAIGDVTGTSIGKFHSVTLPNREAVALMNVTKDMSG